MGSLFTTSAGPEFDEGTYDLEVTEVGPKTITKKATGEIINTLEWVAKLFYSGTDQQVLDATTDEPIIAKALSSLATGPTSKNVKWSVALIGPQAGEPGFVINAEDLIGKRGIGNIVKDSGGFAKIEDITAKPKAAPAPKAPKAPVAAPAPAAADGTDLDDLPF